MKRATRQTSIQQFYAKRTCFESCSSPSTSGTCSIQDPKVSAYEENPSESHFLNNETVSDNSCVIKNINDIGNYSGTENLVKSLSNEDKVSLLSSIWIPSDNYKFPKLMNSNKTHSRSFQKKWLDEFKWLAYSDMKEGSFCKYCVLFVSRDAVGKGHHQTLGTLVAKPFTKFKNAREVFKQHEKCKFHKEAMLHANSITAIINKKADSVIDQIDAQRKRDVLDNRRKLLPIIQTIRLCGRQQISLRGKHDSGRIYLHEPENNEGNFRSLLRFRANSGDLELKEHLEFSGNKTMYTSSVIQNELISIFGDLMQSKIVSKVKKSKIYSVLADETTDISQTEQFSLCIRYIEEESMMLREDFLCFVPVYDVTGSALAHTLMDTLIKLGLNLNDMRGQGYDGAANMRGEFRGVQAYVKEKIPLAVYTHCAAHSLNLCLSHASKVPLIRNCMGVIAEVCSFFHTSAKRTFVLKAEINESCPESKKTKLISLCETRWVQRHDAVLMFKECLQPIISALTNIELESNDSSVKAHTLINSIFQFQFIVSTFVLSSMLSITYNLSEALQNKQMDLSEALQKISEVLDLLLIRRSEAETHFKVLYEDIKEFAGKVNIDEEVPRTCRLQTARCNTPYTSPEEYYRRAVYIPYLDDFCTELKNRFQSHKEIIMSLQCVLPEFCIKNDFSSLDPAVMFYEKDLGYKEVVQSEYSLWKEKWIREKDLPQTAIDAIVECSRNYFPNIYILLKILAVLPVSTATAERSFSTLRRLKSYLRNTTSESRLNGLALLSIHRDIHVNDDEILDKFARVPRNLDFVL